VRSGARRPGDSWGAGRGRRPGDGSAARRGPATGRPPRSDALRPPAGRQLGRAPGASDGGRAAQK